MLLPGISHPSTCFFPYADEVTAAVVQQRLAKPVDLLLGRKTFAAWETYWPTPSNFWPNDMTATKYVASNTRDSSDWQPAVFLSGDLTEQVRQLKQTNGPELYVMGSANMLQTLFKADLVDALELMIGSHATGVTRAFQETEGNVWKMLADAPEKCCNDFAWAEGNFRGGSFDANTFDANYSDLLSWTDVLAIGYSGGSAHGCYGG